jgi:hypothetical protein
MEEINKLKSNLVKDRIHVDQVMLERAILMPEDVVTD